MCNNCSKKCIFNFFSVCQCSGFNFSCIRCDSFTVFDRRTAHQFADDLPVPGFRRRRKKSESSGQNDSHAHQSICPSVSFVDPKKSCKQKGSTPPRTFCTCRTMIVFLTNIIFLCVCFCP